MSRGAGPAAAPAGVPPPHVTCATEAAATATRASAARRHTSDDRMSVGLLIGLLRAGEVDVAFERGDAVEPQDVTCPDDVERAVRVEVAPHQVAGSLRTCGGDR